MPQPRRTILSLLTAVLLSSSFAFTQDKDPALRWNQTMEKFREQDKENPSKPGVTLFVGSSSIRGWDLEKYFSDRPVLNRGFGGSQFSDVLYHFDSLITPHQPSSIILYEGDNDIAKGKSAERVFSDYKKLVTKIRKKLPLTPILFIAIKPSLARWKLVGEMRKANKLIQDHSEKHPLLAYVDIDTPMIDATGKPAGDLFVKDGLHLSPKGYQLWTDQVKKELDPKKLARTVKRIPGKLWVATCQFPVSKDIRENSNWIQKQMREARNLYANVVHFSECALSGYAGVDHKNLNQLNWGLLRKETEKIIALSRELDLWVILGSTHRLGDGVKPHNSLYIISPKDGVIDRYDKRFCTSGDLKHYSSGDHFVHFKINGVSCGALICYDIRFPELFRQHHLKGTRLIFHSFYNARQRPGSIHPKIMPPTAQARAATNNMFLSVNNSSAKHSWESLFVTPDGLIGKRLKTDKPGVMLNEVDVNIRYYDASKPYRKKSIQGDLQSGKTVDHPRSKDRRSF